jgi:hypothetical protein
VVVVAVAIGAFVGLRRITAARGETPGGRPDEAAASPDDEADG